MLSDHAKIKRPASCHQCRQIYTANALCQGIELDKFHTPTAGRFGRVDAPVNALGLRRIMYVIDAVVVRMQAHGAERIGQMQYEKSYRLACIRGPEGAIVGLVNRLD